MAETAGQTVESATMTLAEARGYLGITDYCIRQLIARRELAHINLNGSEKNPRYRFRRSDLDAWLERKARESVPGGHGGDSGGDFQGLTPAAPPRRRERLRAASGTGMYPVKP
ncbi:MAG: helix-turn-helix domain-containing protein [Armatimonadota bacterium]